MENNTLTRRRASNKNEETCRENYHQLTIFQRFGLQRFLYEVLAPLALMIIVPLSTMLIWHACEKYQGSLTSLFQSYSTWKDLLYAITLNQWKGSLFSLYVIAGYFVWAIIVTLYLPGDVYYGPITDKGNKPDYKNNGFQFFLITLFTFLGLSVYLEYINMSVTTICDRYGEFMFVLNVFSLLFCLFLYFKGKYMPSTSDNGTSGNPVFDYYWGVELYPRIGKLDLKLITNCRWGMMVWALVVLLFWMKSLKTFGFIDSHFVTTILIISYLTKFFWWESGYMKTIDISVDRAGFYLCYGCLCFVPLFYALPSIYLAYHPVVLGWKLSTLICLIGFLSLYVNYDADRQRYLARETDGNCLIWNRQPRVVRAKYVLLNGKQSENILLASGYWGLSRHFHYLPELCLAFSWCTTAAFENLMPYLYFIFLAILLFHRSIRDDTKCFNKYGKYWIQYRELVPYKIIPYLY